MRLEAPESYYFLADLPSSDNTTDGLQRLKDVNAILRTVPWVTLEISAGFQTKPRGSRLLP